MVRLNRQLDPNRVTGPDYHADVYRSLAWYSAWYAGLDGSSGRAGTLAASPTSSATGGIGPPC